MRTGLLTIHSIQNVGSVLQAAATQVILDEFGYNTEIINYQYPSDIHRPSVSRWHEWRSHALNRMNSRAKNLLPGRPHDAYLAHHREARSMWYKLSGDLLTNREDLRQVANRYDIIIVGSDQVWHPRTAARDPSFFLDFGSPSSLRASYASSFGLLSLPKQLEADYSLGLRHLHCISVREATGVEIVSKLTGRDAELVLDPTLMLPQELWSGLARPVAPDGPYILCYGSNNRSRDLERTAWYFHQLTNWPIVRVHGKAYHAASRRVRYVFDVGPREWLDYMQRAGLVLAQSFHGVAFSVLFDRPFISLSTHDSDRDSRQSDLLSRLGLSGRAVASDSIRISPERFLETPLTSPTRMLLSSEREKSTAYLRSIQELRRTL